MGEISTFVFCDLSMLRTDTGVSIIYLLDVQFQFVRSFFDTK